MNDLRRKCALKPWLWALLLLPVVALGQAAVQTPKIICDHAAPPRGMHYVCKSQCDCHLEGKLKNDEDGVEAASVPASVNDAPMPKACSYKAPKAGELLLCDSDCRCRPYLSANRKSKKKVKTSAH